MKSTWTYVQFAIYIAPLYQRGGGGWEMSGRGQCPDTFANVWMSGRGQCPDAFANVWMSSFIDSLNSITAHETPTQEVVIC